MTKLAALQPWGTAQFKCDRLTLGAASHEHRPYLDTPEPKTGKV